MKSPLAIIIFNRPDHAEKLREQLRPEESRELFVISDGAREDKHGEVEKTEECQRIFSDWPGKVHYDCASKNMGCKARVSSGLNWVFEHTDRAIILEDDCLPHPDFFRFCDELLEAYSDNDTVMSVCGTKTFPGSTPTGDYFFSKYNNCWGWATWKRAWEHYDDSFSSYSTKTIILKLRKFLGSCRAAFYWHYLLRKVLGESISSWAYCWMLTCFLRKGLHVYPSQNLIVNSGFGKDATHTEQPVFYMPQVYGSPTSFPLTFPLDPQTDKKVDQWIEDHMYSKSLVVRMLWIIDKLRTSSEG